MAATDYVQESFAQALATEVNTSLGEIRTRLNALGTAEHSVADIAALLAYDGGLAAADKLNVGDFVDVADASGDANVTSGWGLYRVLQAAPTLITHFRLTTSEENQNAAAGPTASTLDLAAIITN